jgi:hypothetical protein
VLKKEKVTATNKFKSLSHFGSLYRTSQTVNNFETTATHEKQETQGTKPKFSKQQTTNQNPGVLQNSNHFFSFVLGEIEIRVVKCHVSHLNLDDDVHFVTHMGGASGEPNHISHTR